MRTSFTVLATGLAVACSSGGGATGGGTGGTAGVSMDAGTGDGGPRSSECLTQDAALQRAFDGARGSSPNATLAVKDAACGTRVYVSGSPQTAIAASLWRTGSVTKTYVSAATLSLVNEGKVALDDPLSKWVPNLPNTAGVTVEMLLDHRSGVFNYSEDPSFDGSKPWTPQEIVALATKHAVYFPPDTGFHYSNTNYMLLGMILEAATGEAAAAVLHERAIDVAGLSSTFFDGSDTFDPNRIARGFAADGTDVTFFNAPHEEGWTVAAVVATAGDLVDWVATLYGTDTVLGATGRALLTSRTSSMGTGWPLAMSNGAMYGLGVELTDPAVTPAAGPAMGHAGEMSGFKTYAFYFPDKKTSIAAVVNSDADSETAHLDAIFFGAVRTLFSTKDAGVDAGRTSVPAMP